MKCIHCGDWVFEEDHITSEYCCLLQAEDQGAA